MLCPTLYVLTMNTCMSISCREIGEFWIKLVPPDNNKCRTPSHRMTDRLTDHQTDMPIDILTNIHTQMVTSIVSTFNLTILIKVQHSLEAGLLCNLIKYILLYILYIYIIRSLAREKNLTNTNENIMKQKSIKMLILFENLCLCPTD